MSLSEIIDGIERRGRTLTVFNPPSEAVVEELRQHFETRQVAIEGGRSAGGPAEFAVLSEGDRAITAIDLDSLTGPLFGGGGSEAFREFVSRVDATSFSSYDLRQMIETSREIEDRAWRAGTGSLHAGFQYLSSLVPQRTLYETLARKDLDVHVYAAPDVPAIRFDRLTLHVEDTEEIRGTWFVVFDGGRNPVDKCALLAEERGDRRFRGFWTYDPATVDEVLDHLTRRYPIRL
jgi:hypothetical protein